MPGATPKKDVAASTSPKKESPSKKESPAKKSTSPTKSSPSKKEEVDTHAAAMEHFAQGKRHLLVNDINAAVNSLQEACRMLAEKHGETAPECGDAYFYYGRALLEMARMESDVLGNALDGVPEGDDLENSQVENPDKLSEEEKEKVSDQVDEALQETTKSLSKDKKSSPSKDGDKKASPSKDGDKKASPSKDKKSSPSKDEDKKEKSDEPMEDGDKAEKKEVKDDAAMDTDSEKKEGDKEGEDDESQEDGEEDDSQEEDEEGEDVEEKDGEKTEEDEEDVSNHQLAWEMLELAKVIYQKQEEGNKDMSLKTAQVFLKLGEVGLESENYPQSIEDFQSCLKIQETHMEKDDRCLAETHYQLGVAHSFSDQFDESIESFTKALKIIKDKIETLEKSKEDKETKESEVKELNLLLPEIKEKIEDMEEMKKDATEKINKVKKELGMASAIGGSTSKDAESSAKVFGSSSSTAADAKPMQASMIRKKRKPEDDAEEDSAKKTKAENGEAKPSENGSKKSPAKAENGSKNGHSSPDKMDTDKDVTELKKKAVVDMEKKTKEIKDSA